MKEEIIELLQKVTDEDLLDLILKLLIDESAKQLFDTAVLLWA